MASKKTSEEVVTIYPLEKKVMRLTIEGTTSLIVHAWSEKAKKEMLDKQMGNSKGKKKEPKNPVRDFIDSLYWLDKKPEEPTEEAFEKACADGASFGFPATAVKGAACSTAYRSGWTADKVSIYGAFFLRGCDKDFNVIGDGEFVQILTDEPPVMREDNVKLNGKTSDLRYRGEFKNWKMNFLLEYNEGNSQYSISSIVNMVEAGGFTVGIGEWRPEKRGMHGQFHIVNMDS